MPEGPPPEVEQAFLAEQALEHEAWKASLDPWTRFELETGLRAVPEAGFALPEDWAPPSAQEVAETLQDAGWRPARHRWSACSPTPSPGCA